MELSFCYRKLNLRYAATFFNNKLRRLCRSFLAYINALFKPDDIIPSHLTINTCVVSLCHVL